MSSEPPLPAENTKLSVVLMEHEMLINSDASEYGGSNLGNEGGAWAEPTPWQGQPHSLVLTLPPLAVLFLRPSGV